MILQKISLRAFLEVLWQPLRQEVHAEVVVNEVLIVVSNSSVEVLVVAMRYNDAICRTLIDLRCHNRIVWVGIESAEAFACKIALHGVGIIVHQDSVPCLEHWLHLQECCDWRCTVISCHNAEVSE